MLGSEGSSTENMILLLKKRPRQIESDFSLLWCDSCFQWILIFNTAAGVECCIFNYYFSGPLR